MTIDEDVLRAVRVRAARSGKRPSEVIEDALREALGLDLLRRIWEKADLARTRRWHSRSTRNTTPGSPRDRLHS
jgi:hypothetical protein